MTNKNRAVSKDGKYGLSYGSGCAIYIVEIETGDIVLWLYDNDAAWIRKAVFSRDMRRILCLNDDGSVGVWTMPPRSHRDDFCAKDIVEYLSYTFFYRDSFILKRADGQYEPKEELTCFRKT
jgi:hypothetical protein